MNRFRLLFPAVCFVRAALMLAVSCGGVASAAEPVVRWDFGSEESTPLTPHGGVHRDVPGPRPPEFPDFDPRNTAVKFDGDGAHFNFADPGPKSVFDFTNGDSITLEAWVKVDVLGDNEHRYVIGKGRTGRHGYPPDNQNWALRVSGVKNEVRVSFLFATAPPAGAAKTNTHWHRWISKTGFPTESGWHQIAASYRFGEPESIRGWIDGEPQEGSWDMGGETKQPPVVDDDDIWIGSSLGGRAANSFRGTVDAIAIYREVLSNDAMPPHFHREGAKSTKKSAPEVMPDLGPLPVGKALITFHEGLPAHNRWLNDDESVPPETTRWLGNEFLLPRLPFRYDPWGIRASWKAPVLARMAADVALSPGKHRVVVRTRGLSRLWVDGAIVAHTKPVGGSSDGHNAVTPVATPPLPGLRPVGYGMQEATGEFEVKQETRGRVIFESLVGGKSLRADSGEVCVAIESADGKTYTLVQPAGAETAPVELTDAALTDALANCERSIAALDDQTRRTAAHSQDAYWQQRHDAARVWVQQHPAPETPIAGRHPIDAFLAAKIDHAVAESAKSNDAESRQFHSQVLPILRNACFRCHGEKDKGGLRLNSRVAALKGGDSERPAIVPGDLAASELISRIHSQDEDERMPPKGEGLKPEQLAVIDAWVKSGAVWPAPPVTRQSVASSPVVSDAAFLRRVYFDTVGVPPSAAEVRAFLADKSADKRAAVIDRLLADERWADHWVSYWQDVLAENPNVLKPSLNNTGPFRWFLHEALRDGKPLDRLVTELILLRGSEREGGSAGFGMAADNDAPFAAKGQIVASAFLGIELQCARCHDSPYHSTTQRDLYSLAAMFERKSVAVPKSSTVPAAFFERKARESLIKVTLKPGETIAPVWPFAQTTGVADDAELDVLLQSPKDSRERLAALITSPQNGRFAQVVVNRIWKRLIGVGFVEPAQDWEGHPSSHPELLDWLSRELVAHDYDARHLVRLILSSEIYQRAATGHNRDAGAELRFFAAPEPRRLSAEQVVDSLFAAAGQKMDVEEITFDQDARRDSHTMISLGCPSRAWMFATLSNERDRLSLSLPRAQAVTDVMEAFGWTGSRQSPRTERETDPNVLQPGVLANSVLSTWLTRATYRSELADLAVAAESPDALVDELFLRFYSRLPSPPERVEIAQALGEGFATRLVPAAEVHSPESLPPLPKVGWSNHLDAEANRIKLQMEQRARTGPPADPRLQPAWRERFEDIVWSLVNNREFVWLP